MNYTNEGGYNNNIRFLKNIMGLWIYQECRREWEKEGYTTSFEELESSSSHCTPFLALFDADDPTFLEPGNMPAKIAEYLRRTGQPVPDTRPQMVRCIMESLALKYRMAIEGLEQIIGYKLPVLHIVGGGSKNALLSQFTANAISRPVIAGPTEATAVGNIIVQLIALGEIKDLSEGRALVRKSFETSLYEPTNKVNWDSAYERFLSIIDSDQNKN
jgi:rhamnulokinase